MLLASKGSGWIDRWLPILATGLISALVAASVAMYGNRHAESRWRHDAARGRRWRDAEWIRETTAECLRAAELWRSSILEGLRSTAEPRDKWLRLTTAIAGLETDIPSGREALARAEQADDDYLAKHQAHLGDLKTARKQAHERVEAIERELAQLRLQVPPVLALIENLVGSACTDARTQWIQAKALMEVLAPELGDAVRRLQTDLEVFQDDVSTPDRAAGASMIKVAESFAHMLAEARQIVVRLIGEDDAAKS